MYNFLFPESLIVAKNTKGDSLIRQNAFSELLFMYQFATHVKAFGHSLKHISIEKQEFAKSHALQKEHLLYDHRTDNNRKDFMRHQHMLYELP